MRYTEIDGQYVQVSKCGVCPFYSTECEIGAQCRYPHDPANGGRSFNWDNDIIQADCPLKEEEE